MFCDGCGAQIMEGAKFCARCGAPVIRPSAEPVIAEKEPDDQQQIFFDHPSEDDSPEENTRGKKRIKKKIIIIASIVAAVSLAAVILIVNLNGKKVTVPKRSFSIPQAIIIQEKTEDDKNQYKLLSADANTDIPSLNSECQSSDSGVFAYAYEESLVHRYILVYDSSGNKLMEKESGDGDFLLSGNGKKVVYRSRGKNSFVIADIPDGKEKEVEVDGEFTLDGISYDGNYVVIHNSVQSICYKNGKEEGSLGSWSRILGISDDNSHFYFYRRYNQTTSNIDGDVTSEEKKLELCVYQSGRTRKISDLNPENSIVMAAISTEGKEALFWNDDTLYYTNDKDKQTKTVSGIEKPLVSAESARNRYGYDFNYTATNYYTQNRILNSFYFEWGGSVGYLNDKCEYSILASQENERNPYWMSISDDRSRLWCIKNGKACYFEIDGNNLITKTSAIPVMMNQNSDRQYPLITASSDGKKACFISSDGTAYLVTPETINNPQKVLSGAKFPMFGSDDQLYIRKGSVSESIYEPGELYKITKDNQAEYQYSDVVETLPVKSGMYIITGNSNYQYSMLKEENGRYVMISARIDTDLDYVW